MVLKKQRGIEIESCFGDIKNNINFRRFHVRDLSKVETEITLVAMAHNLRKMYLKDLQKAAERQNNSQSQTFPCYRTHDASDTIK